MLENLLQAYTEWWHDKGNEEKPRTIIDDIFSYDLLTDKGNEQWLSPIG